MSESGSRHSFLAKWRVGRIPLLVTVGLSLLSLSALAPTASAAGGGGARVVQAVGIERAAMAAPQALAEQPMLMGTYLSASSFSSPSGNIRCSIYTAPTGRGAAVCDVEARSYLPPGKPAFCATDNWGHRATVEGDQPRAVCRKKSQTAGEILPYGFSDRVGEIWCTSDRYRGIRCINQRSGVGFEISSRHLDLITAGGNLPITAPATVVHRYQPFVNGKPAPGLVVTSSLPGDCWSGSESTSDPNARRCASGSQIFDPCFVDPQYRSTSVLCPGDPRKSRVTELRNAATAGPARPAGPVENPFFIELSNGQVCFAINGAHSTSHGLPDSYVCVAGDDSSQSKGTLIGGLNTAYAGWTATFAGPQSTTRQIVAIRAAWN
ncbi:MAG: hypothetical protein ACR2M5_01910 [Nakamurella sp.]